MFKTCFAKCPRSIASSSCRRFVHTPKRQAADAAREYVVLGLKPEEESKWHTSDLAKVLVTEEKLYSSNPLKVIKTSDGTLEVPKHLNYGISREEEKLLFEILPPLTAEKGVSLFEQLDGFNHTEIDKLEVEKANKFAKLVDLRNANAGGIAFENRTRCVTAFSEPGKPNDTGRPEVQAALLTMQIRNLWTHLTKFRKDVDNRRALRRLVHQRAKILKYLKRLDRDRYDAVLPRLGLDAASVEGELVV